MWLEFEMIVRIRNWYGKLSHEPYPILVDSDNISYIKYEDDIKERSTMVYLKTGRAQFHLSAKQFEGKYKA